MGTRWLSKVDYGHLSLQSGLTDGMSTSRMGTARKYVERMTLHSISRYKGTCRISRLSTRIRPSVSKPRSLRLPTGKVQIRIDFERESPVILLFRCVFWKSWSQSAGDPVFAIALTVGERHATLRYRHDTFQIDECIAGVPMGVHGLCQRRHELNDIIFRVHSTHQRDMERWQKLCGIELS
jgi:hypothetical protein